MGNCQAAEASTVVIEHPNNKLERFYCSVTANQIMASNPGHLVALLITSTPIKQLKLLRPHDTLLIGRLYRLIAFQDVLNEFAANKCVKLGKLLKERGMETAITLKMKTNESGSVSINPSLNPDPKFRPKPPRAYDNTTKVSSVSVNPSPNPDPKVRPKPPQAYNNTTKTRARAEQVGCRMGNNGGSSRGGGAIRQWKPALQSIAEVGT